MSTIITFLLIALALWAITRFYLRGEDLRRYDQPADLVMGRQGQPSAEHFEVLELLKQFSPEVQPKMSPRERLKHLRRSMDELGQRAALDGIDVHPVKGDGIRGEWVVAAGADPGRRLLYLHGGAFSMGSPLSHRPITAEFSRRARAAVLALDYRLMPEHRRLDGVADCCAGYRWILENGPAGPAPLKALFVAGDSAGGNLTLVTIAWARDAGLRAADAVVALSPATDGTLSSPTIPQNLDSDHMLGPLFRRLTRVPIACLLWFAWFYARVRPCDPRVSPVHGDLSGLPPTLVHASEAEMLLGDARRYVAKAKAQGSPARLETWHNMVHVWQIFGELPESREAFDHIAAFIDKASPATAI